MLANKDNSCSSLYVQVTVRIHLTILYNRIDLYRWMKLKWQASPNCIANVISLHNIARQLLSEVEIWRAGEVTSKDKAHIGYFICKLRCKLIQQASRGL